MVESVILRPLAHTGRWSHTCSWEKLCNGAHPVQGCSPPRLRLHLSGRGVPFSSGRIFLGSEDLHRNNLLVPSSRSRHLIFKRLVYKSNGFYHVIFTRMYHVLCSYSPHVLLSPPASLRCSQNRIHASLFSSYERRHTASYPSFPHHPLWVLFALLSDPCLPLTLPVTAGVSVNLSQIRTI